MNPITAPGLYPDMPAEVYHADPCPEWSLSNSGAKILLDRSPKAYRWERENPSPKSAALDFGTAAHEWLLEPEKWPQRIAILPEDHNGRTKAGQALVEEIRAEGKTPLTVEAWQTIQAMREAVMAHPLARAVFDPDLGRAEMSGFWKDPEFGIWRRLRTDWSRSDTRFVADYKTTVDARPAALPKHMAAFGYYRQAEWYLSGLRELGEADHDTAFLFVFQEKRPPYEVVVAQLRPDDGDEFAADPLEWARIENRKAVALFRDCLRSGVWPGIADNEIVPVSLPRWHEGQLERRHADGAYQIEDDTMEDAA